MRMTIVWKIAHSKYIYIFIQLHTLISKIRSSPQCREKFHLYCINAGKEPLELILDVKTRWNSTYDMMDRALKLREVLFNILNLIVINIY